MDHDEMEDDFIKMRKRIQELEVEAKEARDNALEEAALEVTKMTQQFERDQGIGYLQTKWSSRIRHLKDEPPTYDRLQKNREYDKYVWGLVAKEQREVELLRKHRDHLLHQYNDLVVEIGGVDHDHTRRLLEQLKERGLYSF